MIVPVVARYPDGLSAESEFPPGDAVGTTADDPAEIRVVVQVAFQAVVPEHDVLHDAGAIRDGQGDDASTVGHDPSFHAAVVPERINIHPPAVLQPAERLFLNFLP